MSQPVSAMVLVKNDRHVLETIGDLSRHCAEVIVGWTYCLEITDKELHAAGATKIVEIDGPLNDWAAARNRVMNEATQPFCTWADSDDRVELARLGEAIALLEPYPQARLLAPYWYRMSPDGSPTHVQYRERLWRNDGRFTWKRRCHETLVAKDGRYGPDEARRLDGTWEEPRCDFLVWKHNRQEQPFSLEHQLEMLRLEERDNPDDTWVHYNLGRTLYMMLRRAEAIPYLERAERETGNSGDRLNMIMLLARAELDSAHMVRKDADFSKAEAWAREAVKLQPDAFESHNLLGQVLSLRATLRGELEQAREALGHFDAAIVRPHLDHTLGVDLSARDSVHMSVSAMHQLLGDTSASLEAMGQYVALAPASAELRVAHQQLVAAEALEQDTAPSCKGLDIVFACGRSWATWNPAIVDEMGFGGSETAVVEMARRLRANGHRVRVYCSCGGSGVYGSVEFRDVAALTGDERITCDVLVAWRDARLLEFADAKVRVAWAHDVQLGNWKRRYALIADKVLSLSEWHKKNLVRAHGLDAGRVTVTSNGIDMGRFDVANVVRDPHRVVYSSSLDRGLQVLLDVWPQILARVHDATLHVFYGHDTLKAVADQSGDEQKRYTVYSLLRRLKKTPGVTYHGKVDQKTLAREMLASGVWVGTLWFPETNNISCQEAQAAGLRCIAADVSCMPEILGVRGTLIPGDWMANSFQERLVDAVVSEMTSGAEVLDAMRADIQEYAREHFGWDRVVTQWESLFDELMAEAEQGVMPAYAGRR